MYPIVLKSVPDLDLKAAAAASSILVVVAILSVVAMMHPVDPNRAVAVAADPNPVVMSILAEDLFDL